MNSVVTLTVYKEQALCKHQGNKIPVHQGWSIAAISPMRAEQWNPETENNNADVADAARVKSIFK